MNARRPSGVHLPIDVFDELRKRFVSSEKAVYDLQTDLTLEMQFGADHVVVTTRRIVVWSDGRIVKEALFSHTDTVACQEQYGNARLVAFADGEETVLAACTLALAPDFQHASRLANQYIKGEHNSGLAEAPALSAYCPRCGAPIPERDQGCSLCIAKKTIIRRLIGLVAPYPVSLALLITGTVLSVTANMAQPYITKLIVDDGIKRGRQDFVFYCILGLLGCNVLLMLARLLSNTTNSWLAARLIADLRSRLHRHLQYLHISFYNKRQSGEIIGRVMDDTAELQNFLTGGLPYFLVNSLSLIAIAVMLFKLDVTLALLVFVPVPLLLGGGKWFWSRLTPLFFKHGTQISAVHSTLNESVRGIRVIKAFCQEDARSAKFEARNLSLFKTSIVVERHSIAFSELMFFVMSVGVTGVWYFASRRMMSSSPSITMGDLLAFVGYIWLFYGPLQWFTAVLNWMTHSLAAAERIFGVLDSTPEIHSDPSAIAVPRLQGAISFDDVWFSYQSGKQVLRNVNLKVSPGEMIGLVGRSGAGKSTLVNLIARFYDPEAGLITIDGHPIDRLQLRSLRQQIGMVLQDPVLFNTSIYDNIRYGKPDASFEEVVRATKAAHAHEFILKKEDGYDTVVGENGCRLSGGERQRISIARAILHDPPILILDEATSSVDSETESYIQKAIGNLVKGRTTIAIAHRLATLRNANRIFVIDNGSVAEEGTHSELMEMRGFYWRLVSSQTGSAFINPDIVSA